MIRRASLLGIFAIACGDDTAQPTQPAPLAEVCGAAEPHRVLSLDADEILLFSPVGIRRLADRLYYIVGTAMLGEDGPVAQDATVHSAGPCGEDPVVIAFDVWRVFEDPHFPGLLGCRGSASGDLVALDTTGATAPSLLLPGGCGMTFTEHGLLQSEALTSESARLLLYPYPVGPEDQPVVLFDEVAKRTVGSFTLRDDEVLTLTPESDLLRISLIDGDVAFEQSAVRRFDVSRDGRFLVWQDFQDTGGDPGLPAGKIFVRDRVEGGDTLLAESGFAYGLPMTLVGDIIQFQIAQTHTRIVSLPSLAVRDVYPAQLLHFQIADGRYVTSIGSGNSLLDLLTGEATPVVDEPGFARIGGEHIDLWPGHYPTAGDRTERPLWRHYYDDREPRQLAERVSSLFRELADGRIVTTLDIDEQWLADLVVIDPGTLTELRVDERVSYLSPALNDGDPFGPDTLAYAVSDGDRSGVWIVRPAGE